MTQRLPSPHPTLRRRIYRSGNYRRGNYRNGDYRNNGGYRSGDYHVITLTIFSLCLIILGEGGRRGTYGGTYDNEFCFPV